MQATCIIMLHDEAENLLFLSKNRRCERGPSQGTQSLLLTCNWLSNNQWPFQKVSVGRDRGSIVKLQEEQETHCLSNILSLCSGTGREASQDRH